MMDLQQGRDGRREGRLAPDPVDQGFLEAQIHTDFRVLFHTGQGRGSQGDHGDARLDRQSLLGSGDNCGRAEGLHIQRIGEKRADGVHQEQNAILLTEISDHRHIV